MAPRTLLIPSFLDDHFPLLRHAFDSDCWQSVLLPPEAGLADLGLRYIHSEMCYPAILIAGRSSAPWARDATIRPAAACWWDRWATSAGAHASSGYCGGLWTGRDTRQRPWSP